MKNTRFYLLFLLLVIAQNCICANSEFIVNDINYLIVGSTTDYTVSVKRIYSSGAVKIPSKVKYNYKDYTVISFADNAIVSTDVTSIELPTTIKSLGKGAFFSSNITSISLPNGLQSIGDVCFYGCTSLKSIKIPGTVRTVGNNAFSDCSSLNSVTIENGVTEFGKLVFNNCKKLTTLRIPQSVKTTQTDFLSGSYVTNLYYDAANCDNFHVAMSCTNLTIGTNVTYIPQNFCKDGNVINVNIPGNVKKIDNKAFIDCWELKSCTLNDGLEELGSGVFEGCKKLEKIRIPKTMKVMGTLPFKKCESLTTLNYDAVDCSIIKFGGFNSNLTTIIIGNSVKNLPDYFAKSTNITSIDIPGNVEIIGEDAFSGCCYLSSVTLNYGLKNIGKSAFFQCTKLKSISIPSEVCIGETAFGSCYVLEKVTLPSDLTKINARTFDGCFKLVELKLPDNLQEIGDYAFSYTHLDSLSLPATVTKLGSYIADEEYDHSIYIYSCFATTPPQVNNDTFCSRKGGCYAVVYVPNESVQLYKKHSIWGKLDIRPMTSDVKEAQEKELQKKIQVDGRQILLNGEDCVDIYNLYGEKVSNPVPAAGVYILKYGNETTKILVE